MKITQITVGVSKQVISIGEAEKWHKISITADKDDIEDEQKVIDELFALATKAHDKHSQSMVSGVPQRDLYFNVSKNKEERG